MEVETLLNLGLDRRDLFLLHAGLSSLVVSALLLGPLLGGCLSHEFLQLAALIVALVWLSAREDGADEKDGFGAVLQGLLVRVRVFGQSGIHHIAQDAVQLKSAKNTG